jgi:hypothetical protein
VSAYHCLPPCLPVQNMSSSAAAKKLGIDSSPRGFAERPARRASTCFQQQYLIEIEARPLHTLRSWSVNIGE